MDAELLGGKRDVAAAVGEHALNVFPLDARQARHGRKIVRHRRIGGERFEGGDNLIGVHGLAEVVVGADTHGLKRGGDTAPAGEHEDEQRWVERAKRTHYVEAIVRAQTQIDDRKIGRVLGGTHWQADLARQIDYSKSMISRVLDGTREPDNLFSQSVRDVMVDRLEQLADALTTEGLPDNTSQKTKKAQKLIAEAVKVLRS